MSEFIASAEIAIIPNTRGFRTQLKKELADATKNPVAVKVVADPSEFTRSLRKVVLDAQAKVKAQVLVEPDMRGFESKLRAGVTKAAERVTARVNVTTGAVSTRTTRAADSTRTRRPAPVLSDTGKPLFGAAAAAKTEARAREKEQLDALKKVQAAEVAAHTENIKRDRQRAAADLAARKKVLADLEKQGLLSRTGRPLTGAAREARLEARARAEAQAQAIREIQQAEEAAYKADRARTRRKIAEERDAVRELRRNALRGQLGVSEDPERLAARAQARKVLTSAQTAAITISNAEIGAMDKLEAARAREAVAQKLATEATIARQNAERLGLRTTAEAIAAEEKLALDRLATEQQTLRAAAGEVTLAKRRAFGARGLVAQLATFAGLRGAVLSANAAFIAGTVAAIAFGKSVQSAASFTSQLSVFGVTAGATADQMEEVAAAAVRLGQDVTLPGVGAAEAAEAMTNLAKAGLDVEDSLAGARGVLQLATAAQISNAEATELAASALNAFGLAGTEAVHIADVFANSANLAQGSITDVGIALQQASAVARQVGVSFEDTVALLTLLARNGIRGSDAGTSLRVAFTRLIAPTEEAAAVLDDLNVAVRDSQGNLRPEVFADIAKAMGGMSRAQQDANAKIIFGVDALRAYSIVAREGLGSLNATRTALEEEGSAAELANARMTGLTGAAENLKNQLSSLGLILGSLVTGPLTGFTNVAADLVSILNQTAGAVIGLGKSAKGAFDELKELTTIEIGGFEFGPLQGLTEPLGRVQEVTGFIRNQFDKTLFEARNEVVSLVKEFNELGGATKLNETIADLRKLKTELEGGDEESQAFARSIGVLITQIQEKSADADIELGEMKLDIPPELLRGEAGALAAKAAKEAFQAEMRKPFEVTVDPTFNLATRFKEQGNRAFADAAEAWRATVRAGVAKIGAEVTRGTERLQGLERGMLDIEITAAGLQAQLENARLQEQEAERIVRGRRQQLERGGVAQETLKRAKERLKEAQDLRKGIEDEIKAEAEKAKDEAEKRRDDIEKARNEADEAFFDSLAPRERRVERRSIRAEGTEGLKDDRSALRARKQLLLDQIALIEEHVNDKKAARDEIAKRRTELIQLDIDIEGLTREIADSAFTRRQERLERRQSEAEAIGDIPAQIRIIRRRIAGYNELIREFRGEKDALQKLIDERDDLRREREQLQDAQLEQNKALAQSIFELTGNRSPLLKAIDAQIKDTRQEIAAAKKAGDSTVQLRTELNNLLTERKNLLEEAAEKAKQGTTAFDLLTEFAERFNQSAGNLIGANQPFAGPTGFTADIAQFLRRNQSAGAGLSTPSAKAPVRDFISRNDEAHFRDLIAALDRNTDAVSGRKGNASTATNPIGRNDEAHFPTTYGAQSRRQRESRSGI